MNLTSTIRTLNFTSLVVHRHKIGLTMEHILSKNHHYLICIFFRFSINLYENNFDILELQMFQRNAYICIIPFIQSMCSLESKIYTPGLFRLAQPLPKAVTPTCTPLHIKGPPESPC